jgi:hypothetical protein
MGWNNLLNIFSTTPTDGKTPDKSNDRPTPRAAKYTKRKWRIRTSDKEKDRGVPNDLKRTLGPACR